MERILPLVTAFVVAFGSLTQLVAAPLNFAVTTNKKRFDVDRSSNLSTLTSNEKWGYTITIENKTFKNQENLNVEYRQYKFDDVINGEPTLKPFPGSTTIPKILNGEKFKFDTQPVAIEKKELRANWSYTDGGKEKQKDNLVGYWLKISQAGEVVFEFQYPAEMKSKMVWEVKKDAKKR